MSSDLHEGPPPLSISTADGRIVVQFDWCVDRFSHRFLVDGKTVESASTEPDSGGDQDEENAWPSSPPLQQLSAEVIDGRPVILGVGSAGRSHWSVSVQPIAIEDGEALKFEWACRHQLPPSFLGTTYRRASSLNVIADRNATLVNRDAHTLIIRPAKTSDRGTDCWSYTVA